MKKLNHQQKTFSLKEKVSKQSSRKLITDKIFAGFLLALALICASTIVFIVVFIVRQGVMPFIKKYAIGNDVYYTADLGLFLTGTNWIKYNYGVLGAAINTLYLVSIASIFALIISVLTALFIVRIAGKYLGPAMQSIIELLASIPSIIFGLFGQGFICPLVRDLASSIGIQTMGGTSGLSTIIVLVMMMIPTITMICITSMRGVDQTLIHASLALGATKTQTDFKVVIRSARSGIFAGLILGIGRALGEATAVSMVCGMPTKGPVFNLFDITSTLTSTMMLGIHETSGVDFDIRFSVGIVLIAIILVTNVTLNLIKKRMERI
ncbi:MAG TPA: ABC transporter permease subunit [Erysipelotrichaceae bacterium]|nr:ABC transporter permease subunit [Erysipelotrichaceae bacterium]